MQQEAETSDRVKTGGGEWPTLEHLTLREGRADVRTRRS